MSIQKQSRLINSRTNPQKQLQPTAEKSLRSAIIQRISASASKYQSAKKLNTSGINKSVTKKLFQQSQNSNQNNNLTNQSIQRNKDYILQNQSTKNPGYYQFTNWLKFNQNTFPYVQKNIVQEFWKILRVINYGQVLIPTGLIYQIYAYILSKNESKGKVGGLKQIINNFLEGNQVYDHVRNFRELSNYTPIDQIQAIYRGKTKNTHHNSSLYSNTDSNSKIKRSHSLKYYSSQMSSIKNGQPRQYISQLQTKDVWSRNHQDAQRRNIQKIQKTCSQIIKKQRQCNFKPEIHQLPKKQCNIPRQKPTRNKKICSEKQKWKYRQQEQVTEILFKAKKLDESLFRFDQGLENIPGVNSHINRAKYSQAQKLRVKRQTQRPSFGSRKSIQPRNSLVV